MNTTGPLRVGLVGCGERGSANAAAVGRTKHATMAMVMDVDAALAQSLGERLHIPWSTRLEELLDSSDVDAVLISTPNYLHASQAIASVRRGKHVIVEKPLATSVADATAVCEAARDAGVHLSVFLSYRYLPEVQKARSLVEAGAIGDLFGVALSFQHDKSFAYWQSGYTGRVRSDWRTHEQRSGGGVLIQSAIHFLDWLRFLTLHEVSEVSATASRLDSPGEVEDSLAMWVRFDCGAVGTVNTTSCARGSEFLTEFRIWGSEGQLFLTPPFQFFSQRRVEGKDPGRWHSFGHLPRLSHSVEYVDRFARRVLRGEPPEITGADGVAVQEIVDGAYRSARTGEPARLGQPPVGRELSLR